MSSYASEAECTTYAASVYPEPTTYTAASSATRLRALNEATRLINNLNFRGAKESSDQENEFPREDVGTPSVIKYACCEIAFELLNGVNPQFEFDNLAMDSQTYGDVRISYDRKNIPEYILAGIPSMKAWMYLKPYLQDARTIILERVS